MWVMNCKQVLTVKGQVSPQSCSCLAEIMQNASSVAQRGEGSTYKY